MIMQNEIENIENKVKEIIALIITCESSKNATAIEICFEILALLGESNAIANPKTK